MKIIRRAMIFSLLIFFPTSMQGFATVYMIDDGFAENSIGVTDSIYSYPFTWMNQFVAAGGSDTITSVEATWTSAPNGTPVTLKIWSDPNNDGNPSDATELFSMAVTMQNVQTNIFYVYSFAGVNVTESFFVGFNVLWEPLTPAYWPATIDQTASVGRSWIGWEEQPYATIDSFGFPGNWMIRANGVSPVPEPTTMLLLGIGLVGLASLRRKIK